MRIRSSLAALLLAALVYAGPVLADVQLHAQSMAAPGLAARDVSLSLQPAQAGSLALDLKIKALDLDAAGWRDVVMHCTGTVVRQASKRWHFTGTLALQGAPGGALRSAHIVVSIDPGQNTLKLTLDADQPHLQVVLPLDDMNHMQVRVKDLPLAWLQGALAQAWQQGKLTDGQVQARLSVDVGEDELRSAGRYQLTGLGFDSTDGIVAGAAIDSKGHWAMASRDGDVRIDLGARLHGGQLLAGPVYAELVDGPTRIKLAADFTSSGVRVHRLHFDDGQALRFDGSVDLDADGNLTKLQLDGARALFPAAYTRYFSSVLATAGFADLTLHGMLTASGARDRQGWQRFSVDTTGLDLADPSGRLGSRALQADLHWSRTGTSRAGRVAWDSLSVLGLELGPATTRWQSQAGSLGLVAPAHVPMMGGQVFLQQLDFAPVAKAHQDRVAASIAYSGIDLGQLSAAFGWPAFKGTVGGAIPSLDYDGDTLRLGGGVSVHVFDGFVDVTRLELQQPFSSAPTLQAAVDFRDLNLEPMTKVFGFGSITGRLHGYVHDLRMVAWRPVAFAAKLRADQGGKISQQAVNSISNLGGGGITKGLQAAVLRLFDSFGYDRIGLSCVLHDDVCDMQGLGPADGGGYVIVDGSGLPHISVIGHQHKVDWRVLVKRLASATSGGDIKIE